MKNWKCTNSTKWWNQYCVPYSDGATNHTLEQWCYCDAVAVAARCKGSYWPSLWQNHKKEANKWGCSHPPLQPSACCRLITLSIRPASPLVSLLCTAAMKRPFLPRKRGWKTPLSSVAFSSCVNECCLTQPLSLPASYHSSSHLLFYLPRQGFSLICACDVSSQ